MRKILVVFVLATLSLDTIALAACASNALCLNNDRFQVTLTARDQRSDRTAPGVPDPENDIFGYFTLPGLTGNSANPEVFVKVLGPANGHYWVFYGGLTDFEFDLTIVDTASGAVRTYHKPPGSPCGGYDTAAFVESAPPTAASPSTMMVARHAATSTLLPDGRVLITGGGPAGLDYRNTAELYDPQTGTFTRTGNMLQRRGQHRATLLPNGKVLITGGSGPMIDRSAELYDPATGTFTSAGEMNAPRSDHTATLLRDGTVLLTGGGYNRGFEHTAEIYDPSTGKFVSVGPMSIGRDSHTATLLPSGEVLVVGGYDAFRAHASAELYDPATKTFRPTARMRFPRQKHITELLPNGEVLIAGGSTCVIDTFGPCAIASAELYNATMGTFRDAGPMSEARGSFVSAPLPNGDILVAGGSGSGVLSSAEIFDVRTMTFRRTASMSQPRYRHTATVIRSGDVLIVGGHDAATGLNTAELYDVAQQTFR